jgi:hypothetical protein
MWEPSRATLEGPTFLPFALALRNPAFTRSRINRPLQLSHRTQNSKEYFPHRCGGIDPSVKVTNSMPSA